MPDEKAEMVSIKVVVATGLALTAIAVFVALLHSPSTVAATNGIQPSTPLVPVTKDTSVCQAGEALPAGTSAIRLQIEATTGPRVSVEVLAGPRVIAQGTQGTAWYGSVVTIPVRPLGQTFPRTRVCFQIRFINGYDTVFGGPTRPAVAATSNGKPLPGRVRIAYLQSAGRSWWSLADTVIHHMGLGRAASGTWIVFPIAALASAAIALASWALIRELG